MSRRNENAGFKCENCGKIIKPVSNGSYRNHCPYCLFSKHVDIEPGDRKSMCGGIMQPKDIRYKSGKGFQILHKCVRCGKEQVNKIAENTVQPDEIEQVIVLFRRLYR